MTTQNKEALFHAIPIIFVFILSFKVFAFSFLFYQIQAVLLILLSLYLTSYIAGVLLKKVKPSRIELYFIFLTIIIPFYSAFIAHLSFGQPYIFGVLSERGLLLLMLGVVFYRMIINGKVSFITFEMSFVFMAWFSLFAYIAFIALHTSGLVHDNFNFTQPTAHRGIRYKFQSFFIVFGAIYYISKHYVTRHKIYSIYSLIFFSYILFIDQGRTMITFVALTYILFFYFNYKKNRVTIAISVIYILSFFITLIYTFYPEYIFQMWYLFSQMFDVLLGNESRDISANSRIYQLQTVLKYFSQQPFSILHGIGNISNQWNYGFQSLFGHFYPTDIGIFGGVFVYGLIGLLSIFVFPLLIVLHIIKKSYNSNNVFTLSLCYLLVFDVIRSVQGSFFFNYIQYAIPLFLLLAHQKINSSFKKRKSGTRRIAIPE